MAEAELQAYLSLTQEQIRTHLLDILSREPPVPGKRQVPFNAVETLLCYGLFSLVDPHRYGGANIDQVPSIVGTLATCFRRTPESITSKMLNLDGSRQHSRSQLLGNSCHAHTSQVSSNQSTRWSSSCEVTMGQRLSGPALCRLIPGAK